MDLAIIKMLVALCKLMVNKRSRVSRADGSIFSLLVSHNGHKQYRSSLREMKCLLPNRNIYNFVVNSKCFTAF